MIHCWPSLSHLVLFQSCHETLSAIGQSNPRAVQQTALTEFCRQPVFRPVLIQDYRELKASSLSAELGTCREEAALIL